jgi:acyl-CoA reductase-like NAD-dependent aldehyde dehydrogenase
MNEPLQHWIDGESVASVDGTIRARTDPSTGGPQPNLHVYTLREPLGVVGVITPWIFSL